MHPQVNLHLLDGMITRLHGAAMINGAAPVGTHLGKPTRTMQRPPVTPNLKAKVKRKAMIEVKPNRKTKPKTGYRKAMLDVEIFLQIQPNRFRGIPMVAGRNSGAIDLITVS